MSDTRQQTVAPYKLCGCGCGLPTLLADRTRPRKGWIKGQPLRFLCGHAWSKRNLPDYAVRDCGCWEWLKSRTGNGYGWAIDGPRQLPAHVLYYERKHGPVPSGKVLHHTCEGHGCDHRLCINPDHLEPITNIANIRLGKVAKLTVEDVVQIRRLLASGQFTQREIGKSFSIGENAIFKIAHRINWRDVA